MSKNNFTYLKDYKPYPYNLNRVEMFFNIKDGYVELVTNIEFEAKSEIRAGEPLILDGDGLEVKSISLNGESLSSENFRLSSDKLEIFSPPKESFILEIVTKLYPQNNSELMGLYLSNNIYCTQCEPEGFRRMTYFPDRPDVLTTYRVKIEADKNKFPILLSNGNLLESADISNNRHYAVWHDPYKKPSYLFALIAGDLGKIKDKFITKSGKKVSLNIYCEHGKEDKCHYAMEALKRSMKWDEERFGREYDLDIFNIVAVSDFNFGAMENKGLNIFNDKLILADPLSATDKDYERIEAVVAHEYFHNWTGNRITCRDWFQLCLKEGLTVYRDQEFTSDMRSRAVKRIEDVKILRTVQFPEDAGPLAHPPRPDKYREIDNFYTATVYEKGAEIVRMLALILGKEEFRKGCDLYFERHDGEATTIEAWIKIFEDSSGLDLKQFSKWYLQAGTPKVKVKTSWSEKDKSFTIILEQHTNSTPDQNKKSPMLIPIKFALIGHNGEDMQYDKVSGGKIKNDLIIFDKRRMELRFEGLSSRPIPSLLREFSAPIELETNIDIEDRLFLARHDKDAFNRWQALNDIALEIILKSVKNNGKLANEQLLTRYIEALSETIKEPLLDNALKSYALTPPSEAIIAQKLGDNIDPAVIYNSRKSLSQKIGDDLYDELLQTYNSLSEQTKEFSTEPIAARARSLRNQCLKLIMASKNERAKKLGLYHYQNANNMSDKMAALSAFVGQWSEQTIKLLQDFHDEYRNNILVYDKWLMLNALAPDDDCLNRVKEIYSSKNFPKSNPNRLRALIGTFAGANRVQFARSDGQGFDFVIDVCREIDKINPQSAAGILSNFEIWQKWEPIRKEKAKNALENLRQEKLSSNLGDILSRLLSD